MHQRRSQVPRLIYWESGSQIYRYACKNGAVM
jgi:hypothetical protein